MSIPIQLCLQLLRRVNRGPTAAEGVQDNLTFITACLDDPFKERKRFLRGIAQAFLSSRIDWFDIGPNIVHCNTRQKSKYVLSLGFPPFEKQFAPRLAEYRHPLGHTSSADLMEG